MKSRILASIIIVVGLLLATVACNESYIPKPRGFFRIDFPEKQYRTFDSIYPFRFNIPIYAKIASVRSSNAEDDFINVDFPEYKARIHLTYMDIKGSPDLMIEDAFSMAYKHSQKAEAIDENLFTNEERKVYGILYDIKGNSASSIQFFMTDSVAHYLRGALYFRCQPNKDSLAPSINFIKRDIVEIIESLEWKDNSKHSQ